MSLLFFLLAVVLLAILALMRLLQARVRQQTALLDQRRSTLIDQLATEFPEEVRAWGGPGVLREPAIVAAIAERLHREGSTSEGSQKASPASSGERGLRPVLRNSLLQRLAEALEQYTRLVHGSLWPVLIVGFLAGAFLGWFLGEILYMAAYSPRTFPNAFRPGETIDFRIIGTGILCGLLVWGGIVGLTALWRSRRLGLLQGQLAVCIRELSTEFPDEVRAWGGEAILRDLYSVRELLQLIRNQPLTPV